MICSTAISKIKTLVLTAILMSGTCYSLSSPVKFITGETDSLQTSELKKRESITFILGEDSEPENQYYSEATNYYRYNEQSKTENVVTHCRSLLELKLYLEEYPPYNNLPWGRVNVVVHSNEWSDLGAPVLPEGERASVASLQAAMTSGDFTPVSNNLMDNQTELMVYGCGLGRNKELLRQLGLAFGGTETNDPKPNVKSSRYFISYESEKQESGKPKDCKRFITEYWYAHHPSFHRPNDSKLIKQLNQNYDSTNMDWQDALSRTTPRFAGDSYHYTFRLPIVWYVAFEKASDRPSVEEKEEKIAFVKSQPELLEAIKEYGFEIKDFRWSARKASLENEDGTKEPAIKVIGQCTIVCVLRPFVNEKEPQKPLVPSESDEAFYGVIDFN